MANRFSASYVDINQLLWDLGYKKMTGKNGWIRKTPNGRFHAIKVNSVKVEVHYDFGAKHITNIPMPWTVGQEQSRFQVAINDRRRKKQPAKLWKS